jgi:hypothetical protein
VKLNVKCRCFHNPPIRLADAVTYEIYGVLQNTTVDASQVLMDWKCPRCKDVVEIKISQMGLSST